MARVVMYGIETCDQVRKARSWLKARSIAYRFHDFRRDGLTPEMLARWLSHVPWDALVNRRGLTWRKLDAEQRATIVDQSSAIELMLREPTVIKRPVLETGDRLLVGFSEAVYESLADDALAALAKPTKS
jgi:arsenate reductase (glutaredoxin)